MNKRRFSRPTLFVSVLLMLGIVPALLLIQLWRQEVLDLQLLHAVQAGQPESVKLLLHQGADANMRAGNGLPAVREADAALESVELEMRFLSHSTGQDSLGADPERKRLAVEELKRREDTYEQLKQAGAKE